MTHVANDRLQFLPQVEAVRHDLLVKALEFYQKFLQKQADDPAFRGEAAQAYWRVGSIRWQLGQKKEAEAAYREGFALVDRLGPAGTRDLGLLRQQVENLDDF